MCWLCKEAIEGVAYCESCGSMVCFDIKSGDDLVAPAYITLDGDVYCDICGPGAERDREEREETY